MLEDVLKQLDDGCEKIDMSIGDRELMQFADKLKTNNTVKSLHIHVYLQDHIFEDIALNEQSMLAFADALASNTTLTYIRIRIVEKKPSARAIQALATAIETNTSLTHISWYSSEKVPEAPMLLSAFGRKKGLKILDVSCSDFDEYNYNFNSDVILNSSSTFETLDLRYSSASLGKDRGKGLANCLKSNKTLKNLDLTDTEFGSMATEVLAEALKVNSTLKILNLSENVSVAKRAKVLLNAIKTNHHLEEIHFAQIPFGDQSAKDLADIVSTNNSLKKLDLYDIQLSDEGVKILAEGLRARKTPLTIEFGDTNKKVTEVGHQALYEAVKANAMLENFELHFGSFAGRLGIIHKICYQSDCNSIIRDLSVCSTLLESNNATDPLEVLKKIPAMINKIRFWPFDDEMFSLDSLKSLFVGNVILYYLHHDGSIPEQLTEYVNTSISIAAVSAKIKSSTDGLLSLREMNLDDFTISCIICALKKSNKIKTYHKLDLGQNKMGDLAAKEIAGILESYAAIREVNVENNLIGDAGAIALAKAREKNNTPLTINLSNNKISSDAGNSLIKEMKNNKILNLDLSGCPVNDGQLASFYLWRNGVHAKLHDLLLVIDQSRTEIVRSNSELSDLDLIVKAHTTFALHAIKLREILMNINDRIFNATWLDQDVDEELFRSLQCHFTETMALFCLRSINLSRDVTTTTKLDKRVELAQECLSELPKNHNRYQFVCFQLARYYFMRLMQMNLADQNQRKAIAKTAINYLSALIGTSQYGDESSYMRDIAIQTLLNNDVNNVMSAVDKATRETVLSSTIANEIKIPRHQTLKFKKRISGLLDCAQLTLFDGLGSLIDTYVGDLEKAQSSMTSTGVTLYSVPKSDNKKLIESATTLGKKLRKNNFDYLDHIKEPIEKLKNTPLRKAIAKLLESYKKILICLHDSSVFKSLAEILAEPVPTAPSQTQNSTNSVE